MKRKMSVKVAMSFIVTGCCYFSVFAQNSGLRINEIMASNVSSIRNPWNYEYSDWIEIYNAGTDAYNTDGCYLTDDPLKPAKWKIPFDSSMAPGNYLLFWMDGIGEFNHAGFKLSRSGEYIGIYDHDGNVLDSVSFGYQEDDISYGRITGNPDQWAYFDQITPGTQNPENFFNGKSEDPVFSVLGGYYSGTQVIALASPSPGAKIYYTFDGSVPDSSDVLYNEPIRIDTTTALRVRGFENHKLPGRVFTQTYFINEEINLPMVSLVTDPKNFFGDSIGIYVIGTNGIPGNCNDTPMNLNQDWERPVNVELYDIGGKREINQLAGVRIFGGCSRTRFPEKSLELFARGEYGKGSFDCQIFKDKPIYSFESFLLRSSADDAVYTMMKDGMGQTLMKDMNIDLQAYRPSVVFINGQYWGIHNIREKINEHYVAENYDLDPDDVNLLKNYPQRPGDVLHGSAERYNTFIGHLGQLDMTNEQVFDYVTSQIDVDNYIDYQIGEIFLAANDWPGNNIKFWSASSGQYNRWRWIVYDLDNCFFYIDRNTLDEATDPWCDCSWPNPPWSTFLFRRLLENETFRNEFIQRYAWHMNTTFNPDRVFHIIDSLKTNIAPEIPRHIERWGGQLVPNPESWIRPTFNSVEEWEENIEYMKKFVRERPYFARKHVIEHFGLPEEMTQISISSNIPEAGLLKLNHQIITGSEHSGQYFKGIPLTIKAIPSYGYKFLFWEYSSMDNGTKKVLEPLLRIIPDKDFYVIAHFKPVAEDDPVIVINEINYHSHDQYDTKDWVELYNRKNSAIDLSGWYLMDEDNDHIYYFTEGQVIEANGYLVICEDITAFKDLVSDIHNCTGNLGFGLSNGGEIIRLYRRGGFPVDLVEYDDEDPWPEEADGEGASLELTDPDADNDLAENWKASYQHGTPGRQNFSNMLEGYELAQNFPNPFSHLTTISFSMGQPGHVLINLYNLFGKKIITLVNGYMEVSSYFISWDAGTLPGGIYLYTMAVDGQVVGTRKMVIVR